MCMYTGQVNKNRDNKMMVHPVHSGPTRWWHPWSNLITRVSSLELLSHIMAHMRHDKNVLWYMDVSVGAHGVRAHVQMCTRARARVCTHK